MTFILISVLLVAVSHPHGVWGGSGPASPAGLELQRGFSVAAGLKSPFSESQSVLS